MWYGTVMGPVIKVPMVLCAQRPLNLGLSDIVLMIRLRFEFWERININFTLILKLLFGIRYFLILLRLLCGASITLIPFYVAIGNL